jgi:hypothetical protein
MQSMSWHLGMIYPKLVEGGAGHIDLGRCYCGQDSTLFSYPLEFCLLQLVLVTLKEDDFYA